MRIVDLTTLYLDGSEGGVNTYLAEKARTLAERPEIEHAVVVPGARDEQRTLNGSALYTLKSPRLPSNPEHRVLTRFGEIQRILRDFEPTIVEVDCAYLLGRVAASAVGRQDVPIVGFYHVHLPTFIARPSAARFSRVLASAAEGAAWRYVDFCYRHCDRLVVSSQDMLKRLQGRGFNRLDYVPLGVNLDLFRPGLAPAEPPRQAGRPVTILHVGRLSTEKEIQVLIEAFHLLTAQGGDYRLEIVGDGPMRQKLERQARRTPQGRDWIRFHGRCPYGEQLAQHYAEADILAVPSPNDTFNLTVLEGFAADLPVVAVNRGGPVDLVRPGLGALAEASDAADFAAKLAQVAQELPSYDRGRAHVEEHYSWERTFDSLLDIYEQVCERRQLRSGVTA